MAPPYPPGQGPDAEPDPYFGATVPYGDTGNGLFGASVVTDPRNGAQWSGDDSWFKPPTLTGDTTGVPDDQNWTNKDIEELRVYVLAQQPGKVHALGDQFVNAATVLRNLETHLRAHTQKLFNEHWTQSEARAAFMQKGPGLVMAYLKDWRTQMAMNIDALYDLVDPIQTSIKNMNILYQKYKDAVEDAGNASFLDKLGAAYTTKGTHDGFAELDKELQKRVDAAKEEYNQKARDLVKILSDAYRDQFMKMVHGVGSAYTIPNVIMATPGQHWPAIPPGVGAPNIKGQPNVKAPNVTAPPAAPPVNQAALQQLANNVPNVKTPPNVQQVPGKTISKNLPTGPQVTVPNVGTGGPGQAPVLPPLPGTGGLGGRNAFTGTSAPNLNAVPGAGTGVTAPGAASAPPLVPPGVGRGLARGVLRNPGAGQAPGVLPPPGAGLGKRGALKRGATVRSPAANYTGTGASGARGAPGAPGVLPPPGVNAARRQATSGMPVTRTGALGVPEAFSQGSISPPVAPVLGRPASRRGQSQQGVPGGAPAGMRGAFAPPTATPPVLDATSARAAGGALPPPAGITPQQRARRRAAGAGQFAVPGGLQAPGGGMPIPPGGFAPGRRSTGRYTGQPAPNLVGNPDWLAETGADASASTAPVLRNQMATNPETGAMPPMMPSMPGANAPTVARSQNAARQAANTRTGPAASRSAAAEAERARRSRATDHRGRSTAESQEARPGEEEAFTVQTPGGSVVGSAPVQQEEAPRPTIGNG